MAEQVNQRLEDMISELEQMKRINLFDDEEIKEISRKRKEFEYKVQRHVKQKEDYVHYIAYELTLLEEIRMRRKKRRIHQKKTEIEYFITNRLNRLFQQFISRFQNDVEIYFEYIKFCKGVDFEHAVSNVLPHMLQMHGDKPKAWLLASKWENKEQENPTLAREFLLKGIRRHPDSDVLYLELFEIELILAFKAEEVDEKEMCLKRAQVVGKNGAKNIGDVTFLFKLFDIAVKFDVPNIIEDLKRDIWSRRSNKEVWSHIAAKELQGHHWEETEEFLAEETDFPKQVNYFIGIYEEALQRFPDKKLCTKYIHELLRASNYMLTDTERIKAVKCAWMFGLENELLTNDMYAFGFEMLKLEGEKTDMEMMEILDSASKTNPQARIIWEEKVRLNSSDEKKILSIIQEATKVLKFEDAVYLWNMLLDQVKSKGMLQNLHKKFQNCDSPSLLAVKPKLLQKMYELNGLKAARNMYQDLIKTPPTQIELHNVMISIEREQENTNVKNIRKYFECAVQHHGKDNVKLWMDYMQFETENSIRAAPAIYRRAVATLNKELVDEFIKTQTLAKLNC